MRIVALVLFPLLAFASTVEARQRKALACTVHVEIKDAVAANGSNSALIDSITTPDKTHCESTGKARFIVNNSSDIDVTVVLKEFLARTGGSCANPTTGSAVPLPLEGFSTSDKQLVFKVRAQDLDTKKHKIKAIASNECYKFQIWLYAWNAAPSWIPIDDLDPDLELGPPSGPPPGQKKPQ